MPGIDLSGVAAWIGANLLLDTVRVATPGGGEPVFDPETGEYTQPAGTVVYEGPGAVQPVTGSMSAAPVAGQPWPDETSSPYRLLTPLGAPVPGRDHLVTVTAVHPGGDTALLGRTWRAVDPGKASTVAAVRITPLDQQQEA